MVTLSAISLPWHMWFACPSHSTYASNTRALGRPALVRLHAYRAATPDYGFQRYTGGFQFPEAFCVR